jgi:hypothetical protein
MIHVLWSLLILAAEPSASIDLGGLEAVEVYRCDFQKQTIAGDEQAADVNYDAWPDHWTRRRDANHPTYVKIAIAGDDDNASSEAAGPSPPISNDSAAASSQSPDSRIPRWLQIDMNGGAAAAFTPTLEVSPRFTYLVEAQLRLNNVRHDEAYVTVSFYDKQQRLLENYESVRLRDGGAWQRVQVGPLTPRSDKIHMAVIGVHVTPTEQADLHATVCFADLRMARLPRMSLTANSPHHVYSEAQPISLSCEISGVREPDPEIHLRVSDVWGRPVDECIRRLPSVVVERDPAGAESSPTTYAGVVAWKPNIVEPGFYRVEAEMRMQNGVAHRRELTLAVVREHLARLASRSGAGEFGWSLPRGRTPLSVEEQASLVTMAGLQWVKLPVWFSEQHADEADRLARFVERVEQAGVTVVGVLDQPPPEARRVFGDENPLPIARVFLEKDSWPAAIDPVATRFLPMLRWWQLGDDFDTSFSGFPGLEAKIAEIRQRLERFGQKVELGFAWPWLEQEPPRPTAAARWEFLNYTLAPDDPAFTSAELARRMDETQSSAHRRWVTVQPLARRDYDLATRSRDLVERMVTAKIGGASVVFVPRPFDAHSGLMNADGTPAELFPVWRTTAALLMGSEYLGAIQTPEGSHALVFTRGDTSIMVLWNERPVREKLYLGESVQQIDLWDRRTTPTNEDGQTVLHVGPTPLFVTGVNTAIARWSMSFQFDDPKLASLIGRPQRLSYRFENPFSQGVSGRVTFHTPDVWDVERGEASLKLAAGETRQDALQVVLHPTASSGRQLMRADFEINTDREYRFSVWREIDVGLGDVAMEVSTWLDEDGRLVIEQQFINRSQEPVSFLCQLFAPGRPRVRRPVLDLNQGRTSIVYHLSNGESLLGQTLILRAEEINGDRALNHRFEAK